MGPIAAVSWGREAWFEGGGAWLPVRWLGASGLVIGVALFTAWFALWNAVSPEVGRFNDKSEFYVFQTFRLAHEYPLTPTGGFLVRNDEHVPSATFREEQATLHAPKRDLTLLPDPDHGKVHELYFSQFGLQGRAASIAYAPLSWVLSADGYFHLIRLANMAALALTLCLLIEAMRREFGGYAASVCAVGLIGSTWIIRYSGNVYWVVWTEFLPFTAAWLLYPAWRVRRPLAFLGVVGGLVAVKSLCGYEFISPVVMAVAVPVVYFELKAGATVVRVGVRAVQTMLAGSVGFFAALAIHLGAMATYLGDLRKTLSIVGDRAVLRTVGDDHTKEAVHALNGYDLKIAIKYLNAPVLQLEPGLSVPLWLVLLLAAGLVVAWWLFRRNEDTKRIGDLIAATAMAGVASFSWLVLAPGHSRYHPHLNPIIFSLPLLPTLSVLLALIAATLVRS